MRISVWGLGAMALSVLAAACGQDGSTDADVSPAAGETSAPAAAASPRSGGVLNVYSARHYDGDDAIYAAFEEATGVNVRRIEASGDLLIERLRAEGEASPADIIITVDAGRLWRAEQAGLFQPLPAEAAAATIPARLRDPQGRWVGVAKRLRVIVHAPDRIAAEDVDTYEELADPRLRGRLCVRSSSNIYNLSLLAALIERWGEPQAEAWAAGVVANFARPPQGGDTDQIKAVAAGVCDVALVNHYYWVRLTQSDNPGDRAAADATALIWPDQEGAGVHANISGVGVAAHAPHFDTAVQFIEFLATPALQTLIARSNYEFPASDAPLDDPALEAVMASLGPVREEAVNVRVYGERQAEAAALFDRVGWP